MNGGDSYTIQASKVFDGERFLDQPLVHVEQGRIAAVGTDVPSDLPTQDLGSVTLLPGLVDCHQHLVFDGVGTLEEQVVDLSDDELRSRARASARTALLGGVTTLRDLGDRSYVTLELRGDPELPTLLCAGPPITLPGGHCWYLGGEYPPGEGLIDAVRERIERGCDVVKIMVTGGFMTPATPMWKSQYSLDDLRVVVEAAHSADVAVAAHCHGLQGISDAVEAGVNTIEHCTFLNKNMEAVPDTALLERLAQSDTVLSATFGQTPGAEVPEGIKRILAGVLDAQTKVHQLGGRIVLGSDAGINPSKPHDVGRFAISDFLAIGMSPLEALRALTSGGADALGLDHKGRITPGADADLLAIESDPESEPAALSRVSQVWREGVPVHTAETKPA